MADIVFPRGVVARGKTIVCPGGKFEGGSSISAKHLVARVATADDQSDAICAFSAHVSSGAIVVEPLGENWVEDSEPTGSSSD